MPTSRTYKPRRRYRKRAPTRSRTSIPRGMYNTLSKRISRVAKTASGANIYRTVYREGQLSLDVANPASTIALVQPSVMSLLWGPNHGNLMSTLSFSPEKYFCRGFSVDILIKSEAQPAVVNYKIAIVTPTRYSPMRGTGGGSWVTGEDFFNTFTDGFEINPRYWNTHKSKSADVGHNEHLTALPPTTVNISPSFTQKRMRFYYKFKKPLLFRRGDKTDVWTVTNSEMAYYMQWHLVVLHDNGSASNATTVDYHIKNYVQMPA